MNKSELIAELTEYGYPKKSLNGKSEEELLELLKTEEAALEEEAEALMPSEEEVDVLVEFEVENEEVGDSAPPNIYDPEWTDYVLSFLTPKELNEGKFPRVVGLRRVTGLLIGPIVHNTADIVQTPTPENEKRATAVATVKVDTGDGIITVSGAADCYWGNTANPYRNHPPATAESKAEARALKKLLNLDVLTAEEKTEATEDNLGENAGNITDPQLVHLEVLCRDKLNINVTKLVHKSHPECHNIRQLKHSDCLALFRQLNMYQQMGVPEELKGFDAGWKIELKA